MPVLHRGGAHVNGEQTATNLARWSGAIGGRIARAWRVLPHERRLAAMASIGLFLTLFLPWYQETVIVATPKAPAAASTSVTGWGAFSFVEAAVLLVAAGVLLLLFQRAEGHAFHLPGGDGWVIMLAGGWTCVLVVWRIFDKQSTTIRGPGATISGIEWGIFAALAVAGLLAYAGSRIRAAHRPEPPLPEDPGAATSAGPDPAPGPVPEPERAPTPKPYRAPASGPDRAPASGPGRAPASEPERAPASWPAPAPVPQPPAPPPPARPRGWLSAPRRDQVQADDEQLTIPLEREQD